MKGAFLGEKHCLIAIVEFNNFLTLFSGVESGLGGFCFVAFL